jgi:hypothetical protein
MKFMTLAILFFASSSHAQVVAEAKVYPAPGEAAMTNVEIFDPAAKVVYTALKVSANKIVDGPQQFLQKNAANISCTENFVDGNVQSHFCVMHMRSDGKLLPGAAGSFEIDVNQDEMIRGVGEVRVDSGSHGVKLTISALAAKAIYFNMSKSDPHTSADKLAEVKAGASLTCTHTNPAVAHKITDTYSCSITLAPRPRGNAIPNLAVSESNHN